MVAPSRVGTPTIDTSSSNRSSVSFSHTTTSATDLLTVAFMIEGAESISVTPQFNGNDLDLIHDTGSTADNNDVRIYVYGMVSPGAVTGNITATFTTVVNPSAIICRNWTDTEVSSVAAATNFISSDINTSSTGTSVLASGGSSGNTLYAVGCFQGEDGQGLTWSSAVFTGLADNITGGSTTADFAFADGEYTTLPAGTTLEWNASDQNTAVLIELVALGAGPAGRIMSSLAGAGGLAGLGGIAGQGGGLAG